jgi:hypothetical protein
MGSLWLSVSPKVFFCMSFYDDDMSPFLLILYYFIFFHVNSLKGTLTREILPLVFFIRSSGGLHRGTGFEFEYLGEFEFICQTALGYE